MNEGFVEWSSVKSIEVFCDDTGRTLNLEYRRFNILYSSELDKEFWFNNALTPYAYVGLCIFICTDESTSILDKYEVLDITEEGE